MISLISVVLSPITQNFMFLRKKKKSVHGRKSGDVLLLVRNEIAKFASQIRVECDNAVVVKINKCVFGLDKMLFWLPVILCLKVDQPII